MPLKKSLQINYIIILQGSGAMVTAHFTTDTSTLNSRPLADPANNDPVSSLFGQSSNGNLHIRKNIYVFYVYKNIINISTLDFWIKGP